MLINRELLGERGVWKRNSLYSIFCKPKTSKIKRRNFSLSQYIDKVTRKTAPAGSARSAQNSDRDSQDQRVGAAGWVADSLLGLGGRPGEPWRSRSAGPLLTPPELHGPAQTCFDILEGFCNLLPGLEKI